MYRFIWKIKLKDGFSDDQFIKHWRDASAILQEYPGAQGTLIHKTRGEDRTYFLVAQWESQEYRDAMQADIDAGLSDKAKRWHQFLKNGMFGDIQAAFAGEQIGEVVPN